MIPVLVAVAVAVAMAWVPYSRYLARHEKAIGCGIGDRTHDTYDPDEVTAP